MVYFSYIGRTDSLGDNGKQVAKDMGQIFISHIEEEETVATELARGLEEAGYSVWYYERDSYPGPSYLYQIDQAISGCEAVLVVVSRKSVASQQIKKEIEWAADKYKHFVPVLLDLSWDEFRNQRPPWRFAFGTAVGVPIPKTGVNALLPRILKGLESLGITAAPQVASRPKTEVVPEVRRRPPAKKVKPTLTSEPQIPATEPRVLEITFHVALRELHTLAGHTDRLYGVALTGDGRLAVSACDDHTLKVWEVESGRKLRTLKGHTESVNDVALTGDGRLAVSACDDHTLKVWEVESGRKLRTLKGHTESVTGVALSGDGRLAVSASHDHTLKVWEVESGRELRTLQGHTGYVTGVALTGDARLAASSSYDNTLKIWEVAHGRELRTLQGHTSYVYGVALSGDGRLAVSASHDKTLNVWEVKSGQLLATFACKSPTFCCACSDDARLIIGGDSSGRIYILRAEEDCSSEG